MDQEDSSKADLPAFSCVTHLENGKQKVKSQHGTLKVCLRV